jgi:antitoxin HigA-1
MTKKISYPTPGEVLLHEFLLPMGLSPYRVAKEIGVPQQRIGEIISGKRSVSVDTGLRLSRFFGLNDQFWTGLQLDFDMVTAKASLSKALNNIVTYVQHEESVAACYDEHHSIKTLSK